MQFFSYEIRDFGRTKYDILDDIFVVGPQACIIEH